MRSRRPSDMSPRYASAHELVSALSYLFDTGKAFPPAKAIFTAVGVLLSVCILSNIFARPIVM